MVRTMAGGCVRESTQTRFSPMETFNGVIATERLESRAPGWTCSLRSISEENPRNMRESAGLTAGFNCLQNEGYVVLILQNNPLAYFLRFLAECRLSLSISQFGLAPHFRQVPVGIYNTFRTSSSLSLALNLNASTTYLSDIFFSPVNSQIVAYQSWNSSRSK